MVSDWTHISNNAAANYSWKGGHRNLEAAIDFLNQTAGNQSEQEEEDESFNNDGGGKRMSK
jgi:hypothetical protein